MERVFTGCEAWRALIRRGFIAQEQDADKKTPSLFYCGIFHSHNILCVLVYNITWSGIQYFQSYTLNVVSKNQNNANSPCVIGNCSLFHKLIKVIPAQQTTYQLMSQCCRLSPPSPSPNCPCTAITYVCVHVYY